MALKSAPPSQDRQILKAVPLFSSLKDKEIAALASVARRVNFDAGATICTEGQKGIGLHMIVDGTVEVTSSHSDPATLGPGACFGEIALIDGGPRMATIRATSPVTTLSIVAWEFTALLDTQPGVAKQLLLELAQRLRVEAAAARR